MMTLEEARSIGASELRIGDALFMDSLKLVKIMKVSSEAYGPMTLAIAIMRMAGVQQPEEAQKELMDALSLVGKAEKGWTLKQKGIRH